MVEGGGEGVREQEGRLQAWMTLKDGHLEGRRRGDGGMGTWGRGGAALKEMLTWEGERGQQSYW